MKVSETFASAYLNADSLIHGDRNLQMGEVAREQMGSRKPYVLGFLNSEQRLPLNKSIADQIAALHGDDSDGWRGRWITVFRDESVMFEGKSAPGVRVRPTVPNGVGNSGLVVPLARQEDPIPF
jgi:hypothetical protein